MSKRLLSRLSLLAACALAWTGCTVKSQETPELSGPSEFALSFSLSATPDQIAQDGGSTSTVVLKAYGPDGKAATSVPFRLDMLVDGTPVDYGTLSAKSLVTNSNGQATATYTAPPALPAGANLSTCAAGVFDPSLAGGCLDLVATPIGSNYVGNRSQRVTIRLMPVGVILPPAMTPTANFTFSPTAPSANVPVQFDASLSCPGPATANGCQANSGSIVAYEWSFSDGGTASGKITSHAFGFGQTFSATLTVTNDRGVKASATKAISVGAGAAPTAAFVWSPTKPVANAPIYFDATASNPGLGHQINGFTWNWGDGTFGSDGPTTSHTYTVAGEYNVTLTVKDETNQTATTTKPVAVLP